MADYAKTGGPAFPRPVSETEGHKEGLLIEFAHEGMTLLDHFAGEALPAVYRAAYSWPEAEVEAVKQVMGAATGEDVVAEASYRIGAAMIRAKQRRERRS